MPDQLEIVVPVAKFFARPEFTAPIETEMLYGEVATLRRKVGEF